MPPHGRGRLGLRRVFHYLVVRVLAPIARHPVATVVTGVGLVLSGLFELAGQLIADFEASIGTHHGLILLGVVTGLRGLAELVEGVEWLSKEAEAALEEEAGRHELSAAAKLPPEVSPGELLLPGLREQGRP